MILKGNPVSPGLAVGKVFLYKPINYAAREAYFESGKEKEYTEQFDCALQTASDEFDSALNSLDDRLNDKAKIIIAQKEFLADEEIIEMVHEAISNDRKMPDFAVCEVFAKFIDIIGKAKDPVIAGRVSDLKDVRDRILRLLAGKPEHNILNLPGKAIIVAHDLPPSVTANLDKENIRAIVTEVGGMTSHTSIIARSCGIPAVSGVAEATVLLKDGDEIAVNALEGRITTGLTDMEVARFNEEKEDYEKRARKTAEYLGVKSEMADGTHIDIGINIGSDEYTDDYKICDFIGLFRTEFLFMENSHLPSEEEQLIAYKNTLKNARGKPVTIRTLDIGGDKILSYIDLPVEKNPFLGKRALRFCLERKDIFKTQLRAVLRASFYGEIWLMFPMVGSIDDIVNAKAVLGEVKAELDTDNIPYDKNMKVGVMIEIPSAAIIADMIAAEVDFASIGTNDLCQYLSAVDRMNTDISAYYQSMAPALIRALKMIADGFNAAGKPLSVCGELAGNPQGAVILAGLGIRKLSMSCSNIAGVKESLSKITAEDAAKLSGIVMNMRTENQILDFLNRKNAD